jgi:hypothetical protein
LPPLDAKKSQDVPWLVASGFRCVPFNTGFNRRKENASIGSIGRIARGLLAARNARRKKSNEKCFDCENG